MDILEWIHGKNLLYRDLKPANVLLGRGADTDRIYLADFGAVEKFIDYKGNIFLGTLKSIHPKPHQNRDGYILI